MEAMNLKTSLRKFFKRKLKKPKCFLLIIKKEGGIEIDNENRKDPEIIAVAELQLIAFLRK